MFLSKSSLQSLSVTVIVEGLEKLAIARLGGLLLSYKTAKAAMGSETIRVDRNVRKKKNKKELRRLSIHCTYSRWALYDYTCIRIFLFDVYVLSNCSYECLDLVCCT